MGMRAFGADKLLLRTEQAARVRWAGGKNLWVEPTGARSAMSMGRANLLMVDAAPIPFFPGRESLWIPSANRGGARGGERERAAPSAGDRRRGILSLRDRRLAEFPSSRRQDDLDSRIAHHRAPPRVARLCRLVLVRHESGNLVRAAYRLAADLDLWQLATEEQKRDVEELERAYQDRHRVRGARGEEGARGEKLGFTRSSR